MNQRKNLERSTGMITERKEKLLANSRWLLAKRHSKQNDCLSLMLAAKS